MAEPYGQPGSDEENPSLTDEELEQVAGGVGRYCNAHGQLEPCGDTNGAHRYVSGGP